MINGLLELAYVLDPNSDTAYHYGQIKARLMTAGTPIPDNDLWIAALAVQHRATLAHRDAHFDVIDGLEQEKW